MLSTAKRVAHRNAALALAAPSQVVRQVFEISHFNLLFKIFPSVSAAIAALKGASRSRPSGGVFLQDSLPASGSTGAGGIEIVGFCRFSPTDEFRRKGRRHRSRSDGSLCESCAQPAVKHRSRLMFTIRPKPLRLRLRLYRPV